MTTTIECVWLDQRDAIPDLSAQQKTWLDAHAFEGKAGDLLALPDDEGHIAKYVFGMGQRGKSHPMVTGLAAGKLKNGTFRLKGAFEDPDIAALGFRLGAYRFTKFRSGDSRVDLDHVDGADMGEVRLMAESAELARDLINRPANDLGPEKYEEYIRAFAKHRGARVSSVVGDALLEHNLPMLHAVGRASEEAPRLVDFCWGRDDAPKVTLIGKGVMFDTGGLNIKPSSSMLLMKKDMGGSANILGLAHAIIAARLNVRLRVLIPVAENAISGSAFRPGDILQSRNGMSVEVGNTDAEGRLILADALSLADEECPEMIIDMATLTGAARVAVGPEIGALFSTEDGFAHELMTHGEAAADPLWRMPLWDNYDAMLASSVADVNHVSSSGFAGAITAALFLRRFVENTPSWSHVDIMAWSERTGPGRPVGGTDQAQRAAYLALKQRYGQSPQ